MSMQPHLSSSTYLQPQLALVPRDRLSRLSSQGALPRREYGVVLLADIAGFTALTERVVAACGETIGGERVVTLLNAVYEQLVTSIHSYGGSVISFSGDAMIGWFPGASPRRAVACAFAMQELMAAFANYELAPGLSAAVRLKIALAHGTACRCGVGDPKVQLIDVLTGPPLTRLARLEKLVRPGEVLVDSALGQALHGIADVAMHRPGGAVIVPGGAISGPESASADSRPLPTAPPLLMASLQRWINPALRRNLRQPDQDTARFQSIGAIFIGFASKQPLLDPAALNNYVRWAQHTLGCYDAALLQVTVGEKGNYLYAALGLSCEADSTRQVLQAAVALRHSPISDIRTTGIGIAHGIARIGLYGGSARRTFGVLGCAVNRAARLMEHARHGEILADQSVCGRQRREKTGEERLTQRLGASSGAGQNWRSNSAAVA